MSKKGMEKTDKIGALLDFIERDRVGILGAFVVIFVLAFLRSVMESSVFEYGGDSLYLRANHEALYFAMFMTGTLIITLASGISGRKIFNVVLFGWWIILTPPIIDFLMGHTGFGHGYSYLHEPDLLLAIKNAFDPQHMAQVGWGENFQLWAVVIFPSIYVYLRKKSALRAFFTGFFLFFFIIFVYVSMSFITEFQTTEAGTDVILLGIFRFPIYAKYYPEMSVNDAAFLINQQLYLFVALYYTIMFLLVSLIFLYVTSKERTVHFLKSIKWKRIFGSTILVFAGVLASGVLYPEYMMHDIYILFAIISAASASQFWNMMEDLVIDEEWRKPYTREQYRNVAVAFAILSLSTSYLLGNGPFLISILFIFTGYLYTSKPFEGMKTSLGPFIIGIYPVFSFLLGFYTPSYWLIKKWGEHLSSPPTMNITIEKVVEHPITLNIVYIIIIIYILTVFLVKISEKRK